MGGPLISWLPVWIPDWWLFTVAGLLVLLALICILRIYLGDRKRPARSCPRCWYDMTQTPGRRCSECGRTARSERALARPRIRTVRWSACAVGLVFLASITATTPHVRQYGWLSLVPLRVLPWMLVFDDGTNTSVQSAIYHRLKNPVEPSLLGMRTLEVDELAAVISRVARGVPFVRPPGKAWDTRFGTLAQYCLHDLVSRQPDGRWATTINALGWPRFDWLESSALDSAMQELINLPIAAGEIITRPIWPYGHNVTIEAPISTWWPNPYTFEQELSVSINGGPWSMPAAFRLRGPINLVGDATLPNPSTVDLRFEVFRTAHDGSEPRQSVNVRQSSIRIGFVPDIAEVLTPVRDPAINLLLSRNVVNVAQWSNVGPNIRLDVGKEGCAGEGIAFGARLDLCCNGVSVRTLIARGYIGQSPVYCEYVDAPMPCEISLLSGRNKTLVDRYIFCENRRLQGPSSQWTLKTTSVPHYALDVLDAKRYWKGTVTVPVNLSR